VKDCNGTVKDPPRQLAVAIIGHGMAASRSARLARLRIVAELPWQEEERYWTADERLRSRILEIFASTGARVIVAQAPPPLAPLSGWQRIGETDHYADPVCAAAVNPLPACLKRASP
jgi:hypothetical protein